MVTCLLNPKHFESSGQVRSERKDIIVEERCEIEEALFLNHNNPLDTIFVIHVKKGSPAFFAGLHTGDRILNVNESSVEHHTYQQIAYIQAAHNPESNLNFRFQPTPELLGFPSPFSCSSSWSSHSSLSSIYQMPSPLSYQSPQLKQSSFSIVPPRNPPKPLLPPFAPVSRLSPTPHRKGHLPLSKARVASPSRHSSSQNGSKIHSSSSHHQSKRKTHSGNVKDSNKKRSPNIIDRKQASKYYLRSDM
ncbi:hypothetical protein Avbf_02032 [Armadillidium vulgare]|nr:hypothetical protein Avbf_02032 [Armadillidium vulgare]